MIYLQGWPHVLRQQAAGTDTAVLLDHGPIFKLATLNEFGPERLKSGAFECWWQEVYALWAFTLDMVVWLDAPETILIERINQRDQRHAIKGKPGLDASRFLERYRMAYEQVLAKLTAYRKPVFLHFNTHLVSIEQIAEEVLAACGRDLAGVELFEKMGIEG